MKEALTLLDGPEAAPAARLLQMAIKAAIDIPGSGFGDALDESNDANQANDWGWHRASQTWKLTIIEGASF
ncbi:MAG: hypothetical protein JO015_16705 [Verrucomicrobia bacterium]|nr:hypothetical protein [Verrucomicrobiota bacterium]